MSQWSQTAVEVLLGPTLVNGTTTVTKCQNINKERASPLPWPLPFIKENKDGARNTKDNSFLYRSYSKFDFSIFCRNKNEERQHRSRSHLWSFIDCPNLTLVLDYYTIPIWISFIITFEYTKHSWGTEENKWWLMHIIQHSVVVVF